MKYKLQIQLKSDLCASSGDSFGSLIDNDICYDKYGFPYIPAKRLKGILREEASVSLEAMVPPVAIMRICFIA